MAKSKLKDSRQLPPYPRLGECYRLLANALDTKNSNREVDRLAREGDFDWQLIPDLQQRLVFIPLREKINEMFASYVMDVVEWMHDEYIDLIKNVAVDGLTRSETMPSLICGLYAPQAASFLLKFRDSTSGPELFQFLDFDRQPVDVVFEWLETRLGINEVGISCALYPNSVSENKNGREDIKRWRTGRQLPSLSSISLLIKELLRKFKSQEHLVEAFAEWLMVARVFAYLEGQASSFVDLRRVIWREVLCGAPPIDTGIILSVLNIEAGKRFPEIAKAGLLIFEDLKRTTQKKPGDMSRTRKDLEDFRKMLIDGGAYDICEYYLEWIMGRWYVLAGQEESAITHYERAVDLCLYRSGETQKQILREALLLAVHLQKLPLYKRLKHRAVTFGLEILPPSQEGVANRNELRVLAGNFEIKFPLRGRFVDDAIQVN